MEVVDSPVNLAHQQCRKADRLLAAGKYEEAISCHRKAAELLKEAMKLTECEQARLSLELQRDSHVKQQRLIEERWKRARRENKPRGLQALPRSSSESAPHAQLSSSSSCPEREYDTWLYLLRNRGSPGAPPEPTSGTKARKDDKTRLEEQRTTIEDLRQLLERLLAENERLTRENERLRQENVRLRRESDADAHLVESSELWLLPSAPDQRKPAGITIPHLPPLEMPPHEIPLEELPALELPEDIQHELLELLDGEKL
ncbi:nuclear receptor-binding factor 2b isoform X1 [Ictalurus punctatus]|uniref:Nuclear receptor-binding factor 2 n=1 Tax=Ictalurus punctatus TaxID=7998 RepID=W5UC66_ICTPU|nr:nuclear receptor-binding factor 2b isoform X1 [Ictalurus punctatus]